MQLTERELEERYNSFLDEVYPIAKIGPYEYEVSSTLKQVDPIAYNEGFNYWLDGEVGETIFEKDGEYYDKDPESENEE